MNCHIDKDEVKIPKCSIYYSCLSHVIDTLHEIKMHMIGNRYFEAGCDLGYLITDLNYRITECKKNGEDYIEDQEEDEEESSEDSYFDAYMREKMNREQADISLMEVLKKNKKLEEDANRNERNKQIIFDLQDMFMRLIKFKTICEDEIPGILNLLRNTGVEQVDLDVLCHLKEPSKARR